MMEEQKRYAALMLFQFRTVKNGVSNKKRLCEERIIIFKANDSNKAIDMAKKRGKEEELSYNDNGFEIFFEFIGIKEFIELGISLEEDEVWWRLVEKVKPMENRDKIIPQENELLAFKSISPRKRGRLLVPGKI